MNVFRFGIMGAGGIANKFCEAVSLLDNCEVCAISSKSYDKAKNFATKHGLGKYYDSYIEMLESEKPDCVYIAVTPNDHYRLTMMCVERGIPVLCEKAMFQNSDEAHKIFEAAAKNNVFVMEAMWSRFLPAVNKAKTWIDNGEIGIPEISQFSIGFAAPEDKENRYFNPLLGGGAAKDITVYAYEITTYLIEQKIKNMNVSAVWGDSGVDVNNHISIEFEHTLADLMASFMTSIDDKMIIYGKHGKIVIPKPHYASECFLYDISGNLREHFEDKKTVNGFTYEISEAMECIKSGKIESSVVPWVVTTACSELFDRIAETKNSVGLTKLIKRD
ncbi:MAG: Gfo/Idh/MocA family oxidoreductase [Clostridia bacterium]|nr:Gfo/Idh/MocA family oxidoreductase [Clostridia bacterium]